MDLITSYIDAVRVLLPAAQRDDIAEELEGVLAGRMDDKAAELGRALTRAEQEQVLKDYGHPAMVAARYLPQRTLIGPDLFPFWWLGVRAALIIDVMAHLVMMLLRIFDEGRPIAEGMGSVWGGFWSTGFALIGAITVALAVVEHFKLQPFGDWKPSPGGGNPFGAGNPFSGKRKPPTRLESGGAIVGSLFGIAFWAALPWLADWGPFVFGRVIIAPVSILNLAQGVLGPIWYPTLWAMILAGSVVQLLAYVSAFASPAALARADAIRTASALIGLATAAVAVFCGPLLLADTANGRILRLVAQASRWVEVWAVLILASYAIATAYHAWRWYRAAQAEGAARTLGGVQSKGAVSG